MTDQAAGAPAAKRTKYTHLSEKWILQTTPELADVEKNKVLAILQEVAQNKGSALKGAGQWTGNRLPLRFSAQSSGQAANNWLRRVSPKIQDKLKMRRSVDWAIKVHEEEDGGFEELSEEVAPASSPAAKTLSQAPSFALALAALPFRALHLMREPVATPWVPTRKSDARRDRGMFGTVVFGRTPGHVEEMAFKTLKDWSSHRFLWELHSLIAAQGHPCIVRLVDVMCLEAKAESLSFVLAAGSTSLKTAFREKSPIAWDVAVGGLQGLLGALQHLRERSLVHTDIKPDNIALYDDPAQLVAPGWVASSPHASARGSASTGLPTGARSSVDPSPVAPALSPSSLDKSLSAGASSALALAAEPRSAHATTLSPPEGLLPRWVLVDFGQAELLAPSCRSFPPWDEIRKDDTLHVTSAPYRAPELCCGVADYGPPIDMWSLGVVMYEVASGGERLFGNITTVAELRQRQRAFCGTGGDLTILQNSPCGGRDKWSPEVAKPWPSKVCEFWGELGTKVLEKMLALSPLHRITPSEALSAKMAANLGYMQLRRFPGGDYEFHGARGFASIHAGRLSAECLAYLRADEYWHQDQQRCWNQSGTNRPSEKGRTRAEKADPASVSSADRDTIVKVQVGGRCGPSLHGVVNTFKMQHPLPATRMTQFIQAFLRENRQAIDDLDARVKSALQPFKDEQLLENGRELKRLSARDWFGNVAFIQFTRLFPHREEAHFDGGAAAVLLVVTLWGKRRVFLQSGSESEGQGERGSEFYLANVPGSVYLTCVVPVKHQVAFEKEDLDTLQPGTDTVHLPDLGEAGVHVVFRTPLFTAAFGASLRHFFQRRYF